MSLLLLTIVVSFTQQELLNNNQLTIFIKYEETYLQISSKDYLW
jgi:hypothetical protein